LTGTTTGLVIIKSIIQNNEKHGIFLNSKTLTGFNISSNIISGNASTGLFISGGEDIVIFGNFLRQNSENGLLIANSRNIIVDGNKFEGNKNIGISLSKATSFILIKNNSILDTGLNSSTTDKFKSIAVNMASGTSNVTFKNNLVKNLSATVLTDVGLKIDAGVQKVFVNDNTFASSTKDIIVGTNTRKVCIYNDPKMLRWQKLLCWIQEFLNYSFKI
jgi:parallel beta-helix repeat protein